MAANGCGTDVRREGEQRTKNGQLQSQRRVKSPNIRVK
jgi:hypothetical protein